jgi:hypothetical protein
MVKPLLLMMAAGPELVWYLSPGKMVKQFA